MARQVKNRRPPAAAIFVNAFAVGAVLMGFEMLGSRYLFPYFGGGIGTWAALISMVLCALTLGYFAGGDIVDKHPSPRVIAVSILLASGYLALVPATADPVMAWILAHIGDGPVAILIAAAALILVPHSLLGTFSPVAIRLLLHSTGKSGRVAGMVYGVSTIGNVFGVLFTTFWLIPAIGSREITYVFALVLFVCSATLFALPEPKIGKQRR